VAQGAKVDREVRARVAVPGLLAAQEASPPQGREPRVLLQQAERVAAQPEPPQGARQQVRLEPASQEQLARPEKPPSAAVRLDGREPRAKLVQAPAARKAWQQLELEPLGLREEQPDEQPGELEDVLPLEEQAVLRAACAQPWPPLPWPVFQPELPLPLRHPFRLVLGWCGALSPPRPPGSNWSVSFSPSRRSRAKGQ